MAVQFVVGLFESRGIAEDAAHRLHTEGVPRAEIAVRVLREIAPVPPSVESELAALSVDPLVFGNVRDTFVRFIRNGETAVLVRTATDADVEFAASTLRQYAPMAIEVILPHPAG
jgi:hypothetical protein